MGHSHLKGAHRRQLRAGLGWAGKGEGELYHSLRCHPATAALWNERTFWADSQVRYMWPVQSPSATSGLKQD